MVEAEIEKRVQLPEGFVAEAKGSTVSIKAAGKEAVRQFNVHGISFGIDNNELVVVGKPASKRMNALVGTVCSHLRNMVSGLGKEYIYRLAVVYSHFPMNVGVKGNVVEINNFTGEKKARTARILPGAEVTVKGKDVIVKSHDKEAAGQTAANLENATKVKGKDRRIYQDGIFIVEKAAHEEKEEAK